MLCCAVLCVCVCVCLVRLNELLEELGDSATGVHLSLEKCLNSSQSFQNGLSGALSVLRSTLSQVSDKLMKGNKDLAHTQMDITAALGTLKDANLEASRGIGEAVLGSLGVVTGGALLVGCLLVPGAQAGVGIAGGAVVAFLSLTIKGAFDAAAANANINKARSDLFAKMDQRSVEETQIAFLTVADSSLESLAELAQTAVGVDGSDQGLVDGWDALQRYLATDIYSALKADKINVDALLPRLDDLLSGFTSLHAAATNFMIIGVPDYSTVTVPLGTVANPKVSTTAAAASNRVAHQFRIRFLSLVRSCCR
jgi:hypothetical protein